MKNYRERKRSIYILSVNLTLTINTREWAVHRYTALRQFLLSILNFYAMQLKV